MACQKWGLSKVHQQRAEPSSPDTNNPRCLVGFIFQFVLSPLPFVRCVDRYLDTGIGT